MYECLFNQNLQNVVYSFFKTHSLCAMAQQLRTMFWLQYALSNPLRLATCEIPKLVLASVSLASAIHLKNAELHLIINGFSNRALGFLYAANDPITLKECVVTLWKLVDSFINITFCYQSNLNSQIPCFLFYPPQLSDYRINFRFVVFSCSVIYFYKQLSILLYTRFLAIFPQVHKTFAFFS